MLQPKMGAGRPGRRGLLLDRLDAQARISRMGDAAAAIRDDNYQTPEHAGETAWSGLKRPASVVPDAGRLSTSVVACRLAPVPETARAGVL